MALHLFSITLFDEKSPGRQYKVALWAGDRENAYRRGMDCGRVLSIERLTGTWPLDVARTPRTRQRDKES
jgi:hypothetical protein